MSRAGDDFKDYQEPKSFRNWKVSLFQMIIILGWPAMLTWMMILNTKPCPEV